MRRPSSSFPALDKSSVKLIRRRKGVDEGVDCTQQMVNTRSHGAKSCPTGDAVLKVESGYSWSCCGLRNESDKLGPSEFLDERRRLAWMEGASPWVCGSS